MNKHVLFAAPIAVVCVIALAIHYLAISTPIDRLINDLRMTIGWQSTSGEIVYVAVDSKSLREVGIWPWPRSIHAQLLDVLTQAGARDVFFDFDFAFSGEQSGDAAFAGALDRAGGTTYLPVFAQPEVVDGVTTALNAPLSRFAELSWPALVNVYADADGILRNYLYGLRLDNGSLASAAALLSGQFGPDGASFAINYAIDPDDLPTYSFSDVIAGRIPAETFTDRIVIVGAYALELRDTFAVPVHGIVPGPAVHALATETLISGAIPRVITPAAVLPFLALLTYLLHLQSRTATVFSLIRLTGIGLLLFEVAGFVLFQRYALLLPTGMIYPSLLSYGIWRMADVMGVNNWMIQVKQVQLENTVDILGQVFADSSDAILVIDSKGTILHHSKMAERIFGTTHEGYPNLPEKLEWAVARAIAFFADDKWQPDRTREIKIGKEGAKRIIEYTITPSRVQSSFDEGTSFIATIAARDVTENRVQAARIDYISSHDERTGAVRRSAFFRSLSQAARDGTPVAIFAINLHRFKTINLTLGRDIGDQVLRQVVVRLQQHPARFGQVMRLDGDSFAVFLSNLPNPNAAREIARDIVRSVTVPFSLEGARAQVGVRVGFAMDRLSREVTGHVLLDRAEEALDLARSSAGNRIAGYDSETARTRVRARAIEQAMSGAIGREEFHMLYQPQIRMRDSALCGVEALVRWTHPDLGPIGPDEFIPIAESNGFIQDLGRWVLHRAMSEGMRLPPHVSLAVNVSAIQMMSNRVVYDVRTALDSTGFQPDRLWLELTESTLLTPNATMLKAMADIEALGAAWALDDFGTGFSSLNYMATLPIRKLKVDRAFVSDLGRDHAALAIIRSVQVMCEGLGITMLCEGIETEEQARILRTEKCGEGQGYLYGKPLSMSEIITRFGRTRRIA